MKLVFVTNSPSPYRVDFYHELIKSCDVTVIFEKSFSIIHDESWKKLDISGFTSVEMSDPNEKGNLRVIQKTLKYLRTCEYDYLIVEGCMPPLKTAIAAYCRFTRRAYWIDADGGFPKSGVNLREVMKRFAYSAASGAFSSGKMADAYFLHYGVKAERLHRYPFTSLCQRDIDSYAMMAKKGKQYYRDLLGIRDKRMVIAVGRFVPGKGFDVLLQSASGLPEGTGVYIVGGKPTRDYLEICEKNHLDCARFIDFVLKDELSMYYLSADVFVLPTRSDVWGLVINEAMAHGLPVISTDKCVAALELIEEGVNGSVVPVDDVEALHGKLMEYLADDDMCSRMGRENMRRIREYTTENMAAGYYKAFIKDQQDRMRKS